MDEPVILRASSFGSCIRAQVAVLLGSTPMPPNEKLQGYFDRGTAHEDDCIARMRAEGWLVVDQQAEVTLEPVPGVVITGHLDGRCLHPEDPHWRVLEVKRGTGYTTFEKASKQDDWTDPLAAKYGWQSTIYMQACDEELTVARLNDEGVIEWFVRERPAFSASDLAHRAAAIEALVVNGVTPELCSQDDGWSCPMRYLLCGSDAPEITDDEHFDSLVNAYESFKAERVRAEGYEKAAREELRAYMADREQLETAHAKVTVYTQKNPPRWDEKGLINEYSNDVLKYRSQGESERMKVTVRSDEGTEDA